MLKAMQLSIQYLRAVAALMVLTFHCFHSISFMRAAGADLNWLKSGVDLFFVVSGYVMVHSTRGKDCGPADFMWRRICRIVPLYWLATAIMAFTSYPGETLFKIGSLFFLPVTHPATGYIEPLVQPGWTLVYEMSFYALFAMTMLAKERSRFWIMAGTLSAIVATGTLASASNIATFYSNSIILEFALGMAIARFGLRLHLVAIPLGIVFLVLGDGMALPRLIQFGLPAAMIVSGALSLEGKLPHIKPLSLLGDASYSIYLFHIMLLAFWLKIWTLLAIDRMWFVPLALLFAGGMGTIMHLVVEKPINNWTQKWLSQRRQAGGQASSLPSLSATAP